MPYGWDVLGLVLGRRRASLLGRKKHFDCDRSVAKTFVPLNYLQQIGDIISKTYTAKCYAALKGIKEEGAG